MVYALVRDISIWVAKRMAECARVKLMSSCMQWRPSTCASESDRSPCRFSFNVAVGDHT